MDKPTTVIMQIPFPGFDGSIYSDEVDHILELQAEWIVEDEREEGIAKELWLTKDEYIELLSDCLDYSECYRRIAKAYVDVFDILVSERLDYKLGLEFESMSSPQYYNFETDRVFVYVPVETVKELFAISEAEDHKTLAQVILDRHTSYDGFISFYGNELSAWLEKPVEEWDHNELHTLLLAVMRIVGLDEETLYWDAYYGVAEGGGICDDFDASVDWEKFKAAVAELREEKRGRRPFGFCTEKTGGFDTD